MENNYNKYFFDNYDGGDYSDETIWADFFRGVADKIIDYFSPKSILDAGCANGYLVRAFRERGVEAWGIDISSFAINSAPAEIRPYLNVQSITDPLPESFPKKFDIAITIEVLEHLFPEDGAKAIERLCSYADNVLFSSTHDDIEDKMHVNVQLPEYWAKEFAKNSFYRDLIQPVDFISPQAMLFKKQNSVPNVIFDYELTRRIDKLKASAPKAYSGKIYFDTGLGFSESNSIDFSFEANTVKTQKINIPAGCRALRVDPLEHSFTIVSRPMIATNAGFKRPSVTNASCLIGDSYYFISTDPQIHFDLSDITHIWFELSADIRVYSDPQDYLDIVKLIERANSSQGFESERDKLSSLASALTNENNLLKEQKLRFEAEGALLTARLEDSQAGISRLKEEKLSLDSELSDVKAELSKTQESLEELTRVHEENVLLVKEKNSELENEIEVLKRNNDLMLSSYETAERELEYYKTNYCAAMNQVGEWRTHASNLEGMYNNVAHSFFWKISKPIRWLLDGLKKFAKKIKPLRLFFKFFKCWRENGWKYTMNKLKSRKKYIENISKPLYTKAELEAQRTHKFSRDVKISVLVPLYNTPINFLREMIDSVVEQTYPNWELCLADGSDKKHKKVEKCCKKYAARDSRIVYKKLEKNLGISENTNACIDMSSGDYIALFDHDDILHSAAFYNVMEAICDKGADYIYTDEATFESPNIHKISTIHYKPDFAIDNLRANNYICHLSVFSREVLEKAGKFRKSYDGSQDHDIILRLTSNAGCVVHIPKVLYFWRSHPNSVAMDINSKTYAITAGRNAVHTSIVDNGFSGTVESTKVFPAMYKVNYDITSHDKVSVIIANPRIDVQFINSINSVRGKTKYNNYEIIVAYDTKKTSIDTVGKLQKLEHANVIRTLELTDIGAAKALNLAAKEASGKYLAFIDGAACVANEDWIEELLMYAQRDDMGVVGGAIYFMDNSFKHAGYVIGHGDEKLIQSLFFGVHNSSVGYMGRLWYAQNLSAVSGELFMVKRELFLELGGFDESLTYHYDVDFCMNARQNGKLVVWTPYSNAHSEFESSLVLADDIKEESEDITLIRTKWAKLLTNGDPYYNKNFAKDRVDFSL